MKREIKYRGDKVIDYNSITEFTNFDCNIHMRDEYFRMVYRETNEPFTGAMRFDNSESSIFAGPVYHNEVRFLYHKRGLVHRIDGPAIIVFNSISLYNKRSAWYHFDSPMNTEELFYAMARDGIDMFNITPEDKVFLEMKYEKGI